MGAHSLLSNRSGATVWLVCTRIRATLGCILVTDRKKKYPYKQTETGFRMEIETGFVKRNGARVQDGFQFSSQLKKHQLCNTAKMLAHIHG